MLVHHYLDYCTGKRETSIAEPDQVWILTQIGFYLRAMGRMHEGSSYLVDGLKRFLDQRDWLRAAQCAVNLSELFCALGYPTFGVTYAAQSMELADRSRSPFWMISTASRALATLPTI